jgi:two-component system, chemotaxis family, protein-glutamate methylesterase/glutaminase
MTDAGKIKVLVVEDSTSVRMLLVHILNADPNIQIVGTARNGREALQFLTDKLPDVILMDIEMPEMDGFETTRHIMETRPVPIVICAGSTDPRETITTFRLMEAGAVACVEKPRGLDHKNFDAMAAHLVQTVKLMSEVKVVRRWSRLHRETPNAATKTDSPKRACARVTAIGIGASTGGPPVLQTILAGLPKDFAAPLLIVQHISPGFLAGLVEWLNQTTGVKVHIGAHGTSILPGHAYLAPDDMHMGIGPHGQIALSGENPESGLRPSVAHLFRSLAQCCGPDAVGVLLTGMARDGAEELKRMRDAGAITIAQDRETSIVHGMPGEAIALGAATYVLPAQQIAPALVALIDRRPISGGKTS